MQQQHGGQVDRTKTADGAALDVGIKANPAQRRQHIVRAGGVVTVDRPDHRLDSGSHAQMAHQPGQRLGQRVVGRGADHRQRGPARLGCQAGQAAQRGVVGEWTRQRGSKLTGKLARLRRAQPVVIVRVQQVIGVQRLGQGRGVQPERCGVGQQAGGVELGHGGRLSKSQIAAPAGSGSAQSGVGLASIRPPNNEARLRQS